MQCVTEMISESGRQVTCAFIRVMHAGNEAVIALGQLTPNL